MEIQIPNKENTQQFAHADHIQKNQDCQVNGLNDIELMGSGLVKVKRFTNPIKLNIKKHGTKIQPNHKIVLL